MEFHLEDRSCHILTKTAAVIAFCGCRGSIILIHISHTRGYIRLYAIQNKTMITNRTKHA
ncbi:hypothetical protein RchiOBHm_Chr5g0010511 [Rosa chinensis]|uniref:Uncharacterized protein n=1 Tax=Rosa chinensis TaxID=74649 RepID=A0A2P6Q4L6_ROSCH|nr:hypothetical protein RchiOBHm_Chr5g0010511 [Rosa chinensis]